MIEPASEGDTDDGPAPPLKRGVVSAGTLSGDPPLAYHIYVPSGAGNRILVSVHGISEQPEAHAEIFAPFAERHGVVVVAPHFSQPEYADYQRLGRAGRGVRADLALDRLVSVVAQRVGASAGRFFLFGYSGGGQFAHRYAMAHPRRVVAAVVASAGWYTHPRRGRRYPHGIGPSDALTDVTFDPDAFLRVPMLVTVGERDTARDPAMRQSERIDRQQGPHRLARAERFATVMAEAARRRGLPSPVALRVLPGVEHSFEDNVEHGALADLAFEFLFGPDSQNPLAEPDRGPA